MKVNYGGQAVIEGVMMRGTRFMSVAVRAANGEIVWRTIEIPSPLYAGKMSRLPLIRGLVLLWDSLGMGMRALIYSANVAAGEEIEIPPPAMWGTIAVSASLGIALFFLLPAALGEAIKSAGVFGAIAELQWMAIPQGAMILLDNLVEGIIRLAIVLSYIWLIGKMPHVKRMWQYHGAEHKTIHAFEKGVELNPINVRPFPLAHPRCGTGFLLVIIVVSIFVTSLIGDPPFWLRLLSRVVMLPIVIGVAYEYIRLTARYAHLPFVKLLIAPQLWLQALTTAEPSDDILEVSIRALKGVVEAEQAQATIDSQPVKTAPESVSVEAKA